MTGRKPWTSRTTGIARRSGDIAQRWGSLGCLPSRIGASVSGMAQVDQIRDAHPDEAVALEALHRRSSDVWDEDRAHLAAHPDAIEPPHQAIVEGRVRVAVNGAGRRLGFSVVLLVKDGTCELDDLFVEPDSMGLGVGRLLVQDVVARARAAGATRVNVTANPRAVGFYERLGFRITGETTTQFARAPRMSLDLSRSLDPLNR
jgi:ribosomal protein S18 acetylase RimI-like enzyme